MYAIFGILTFLYFAISPFILCSIIKKVIKNEEFFAECITLSAGSITFWFWLFIVFSQITT